MDPKLTELLTTPATKLGTTTEYLWAVLVRQAPITAITDLIYYLIYFLFLGFIISWLWKHREITDNILLDVSFGMTAGLSIIGILGIGWNLPHIVAGIVNPEYWALHQILK